MRCLSVLTFCPREKILKDECGAAGIKQLHPNICHKYSMFHGLKLMQGFSNFIGWQPNKLPLKNLIENTCFSLFDHMKDYIFQISNFGVPVMKFGDPKKGQDPEFENRLINVLL